MKYLLIAALLCPTLTYLTAQSPANPHYDEALADTLGGDEYGMKSYVLVLLTSGEKETVNDEATSAAFAGHMSNMDRLSEENILYVAGPFGTNDDDLRGLFVLNVATTEEAKSILDTDPAISAGYLSYKLYPWYSSAALGTFIEQHDKIWKKAP